MSDWSPERAQETARAKGMCGELLDGGRNLCILEPGHGRHGTVQDIARAYYEGFDWSGCDGSSWEKLPAPARAKYVRQVHDWMAAIQSAGAKIVRA